MKVTREPGKGWRVDWRDGRCPQARRYRVRVSLAEAATEGQAMQVALGQALRGSQRPSKARPATTVPAGASAGSCSVWQALRRAETEHYSRLTRAHGAPAITDRLLQELERVGVPAGADLRRVASRPLLVKLRGNLLGQGLAPSTVNRYLARLGKVLTLARDDWGLDIPAVRVPKLSEQGRNRTRTLTASEEVRLEAEADPLRSLLVWLLDTGMRLSEALETQWLCLRQGAAEVTVTRTKTKRARTVPLTQRAQRVACGGFPWAGMTVAQVEHLWRAARRRVADDGVGADLTLHCLRHTCATRLLRLTGNLMLVKEWLGHASVTTTQVYAHVDTGLLSQGAQLLDSKPMSTTSASSEGLP